MNSAETQTSDQRIILTKALLVAQTRAKEFQEVCPAEIHSECWEIVLTGEN
jgi:hypothetical protein